jgi:hypothetical protein
MITILGRRVERMARLNGRRDGPCRCDPPVVAEIVHVDPPGDGEDAGRVERVECQPARCCRCGGYGVVLVITVEVVGPPAGAGPARPVA